MHEGVFLVGDCPPHMDYRDDVKYPDTCREAVKRLIVINTVQCGGVRRDDTRLAGDRAPGRGLVRRPRPGREHAGHGHAVRRGDRRGERGDRPHGGRLREARAAGRGPREGREGRDGARRRSPRTGPSSTSRAAGRPSRAPATWWPTSRPGTVDLAKIAKDDLPPEMQRMSLAEQRAYVQARQAERDALNARLASAVAAARRLHRRGAAPAWRARVIRSTARWPR